MKLTYFKDKFKDERIIAVQKNITTVTGSIRNFDPDAHLTIKMFKTNLKSRRRVADMSPMTHPCKYEHVCYADVISAS